ncbi:MAG: hypothetical protein H6707_14535 [Deltaproteobacteria bacterium]|nr:hypothetical protein [Deltaproteobacteria bacterium]
MTRRHTAQIALATIAFGLLSTLSLPTFGYVPSRTEESKTTMRWFGSNCIYIRPNSVGSSQITDGSEVVAIGSAMTDWEEATKSCSYMRFQRLDPSPDSLFGTDKRGPNEVAVVFVEGEWAVLDQNNEYTRDPMANALTTISFIDNKDSDQDGRIIDADVELNGSSSRGTKFGTDGSAGKVDVENLVAHELGHVLGLDHTCFSGRGSQLDGDGNPVPSCFSKAASLNPALTKEQKDATMFFTATSGETKKRSPEPDDIDGICSTYPIAKDPGQCVQVDLTPGCADGCAVSDDGALGWVPLAAVLFVAFLLGRRRRLPAS